MKFGQTGICGGCGLKRQSLKPSKIVANQHLRCGKCRIDEWAELKAEQELDKMIEGAQ